MKRGELAAAIEARLESSDIVVCGLGSTSRAWLNQGSDKATHYASDPMGLAPGLALGLALAQPDRRVFLLEGDGDLLMNLGVLVTIAGAAPSNLRIVVFRNGRYETGGGQDVPGERRLRLAEMGAGAGLEWSRELGVDDSHEAVGNSLDELLSAPAPSVLVVGVEAEASPYGGPGPHSGVEARVAFQSRLQETDPDRASDDGT